MCSPWTPIGGIAAQLNHVAVLLSLATLESAGFALRYRELLIRTLADHARARFPFDYSTALSEVHGDTRRVIATDSARASYQPPSKWTKQRTGKGKSSAQERKKGNPSGKGTKSNRGKKGKDNATRPTGKGPTPLTTANPPPASARSPFDGKAVISNTSKG